MKNREMCGSEVFPLGFGCMRFPQKGRKIDREKSAELLDYARAEGVNYYDTAYPYHMGESEEFLGDYMEENSCRSEMYIATKMPCMIIRKKGQFEGYFAKQLKRLKTDYIDFYLLHALNGPMFEKMCEYGILEFITELKETGKVKHLGFSFHGTQDDFVKIVDAYDWEFCQIQYNFLDENFQAGTKGLEYAAEKGLSVIIMEPLRGGALVKVPEPVAEIYDSAVKKNTPAQWAFKWLYNKPEVTVVLSGMNDMEQLRENISIAADTPPSSLTDNEVEVMEKAKEKYRELFKVGCTECRYCMPCPAGINIPETFKNLNGFHMFSKNMSRFMHLMYAGIHTEDGKSHFTSTCIDCGKCEKACPQHIQIRKEFKQVKRDLEGPVIRLVGVVVRMVLNWRRKLKV